MSAFKIGRCAGALVAAFLTTTVWFAIVLVAESQPILASVGVSRVTSTPLPAVWSGVRRTPMLCTVTAPFTLLEVMPLLGTAEGKSIRSGVRCARSKACVESA